MTTYTAANSSELTTVLSQVAAGDTIDLTGDTYGVLDWGASYGTTVTMRAANGGNKPLFQFQADVCNFNNLNGVRFENTRFQRLYVDADAGKDTRNTIQADAATNLYFDGCEILGGTKPDGNYNGRGINDASAGSNWTFNGCIFHELFKGYTGNTNQINFINSEFTALRSDGMSLGQQTDILIERCHFHDFNTVPGSSAHPDMIQIYRNNSIGTANLTVRDCVFDVGLGRYGQGLFAGTSGEPYGGPGTATRHTNWLIENNIFHVDHTNMCEVNWVDGITIRRNSLFIAEASNNASESSIGVDGTSTNVTIQENIVGTVPNSQAGWTISNNTIVQEANYPTQVNFIASTDRTNPGQGFSDDYHDYEIKTGGTAHTNLHGARISKREGGWSGNGRTPPTSYQGGYGGATPLPTLPASSVATTVTVP